MLGSIRRLCFVLDFDPLLGKVWSLGCHFCDDLDGDQIMASELRVAQEWVRSCSELFRAG